MSDRRGVPCSHVREQLDSLVSHEHVVFDPHAAPAWEVGARLDREDHAGCDALRAIVVRAPPRYARLLVHFDSESVAGAMTECIGHPVRGERIARRRIDRPGRNARC